jgi:hypothetical protein
MERIMKRPYLSCLSKVLKLALLVLPASALALEEIIPCESDNTKNYPNRYTVNMDQGTVLDKMTGLMWDRCYYGLAGAGCDYQLKQPEVLADLSLTYEEMIGATALQHMANINEANTNNYLGYSDWYMPNVKELSGLSDNGCLPHYINPEETWETLTAVQPSYIFPLIAVASFYRSHPYMISSTPANRDFPNERLVVQLTSIFPSFAMGIPGEITNKDANAVNLFALKLVRKVQKAEFELPATLNAANN